MLQVETQFLLLELDSSAAAAAAAGEEGTPAAPDPAAAAAAAPRAGAACYALLLPLIDGGRFRGTLRPPRWVARLAGAAYRSSHPCADNGGRGGISPPLAAWAWPFVWDAAHHTTAAC